MIRKTIGVLLLIVLISVALHAQIHGYLVRIGAIQIAITEDELQAGYQRFLAEGTPPMLAWMSSAGLARQNVEVRVSSAMKDFCERDPVFCQDVFERYGLRLEAGQ